METKKIIPINAEQQKEASRLYKLYNETVFNHVLRVVKNYHDSENVMTDVFVKIMKLKLVFDPDRGASEATWIHTITNSVIIDFFRTNHQDHYKSIGDYVDDEGRNIFINIAPKKTNTDSDVLTDELQNRIKKAFSGLKPKYRFIAKMYFKKEYSYKELSEMFDLPMGSIKGTINRIRQKLQTELSDLCIQKNNVQNIEA